MNIIRKNLKILLFTALLFTNTSFCLAANLSDAFGNNLNNVGVGAGYNTATSKDSIIGSAIKIFLSLMGIIFVILMLYGGYLWMTDMGNEKTIDKAKKVIQAAIIGLLIVFASYAITYFIIQKFGDAALTK